MVAFEKFGAMFMVRIKWQDAKTAEVKFLPSMGETKVMTEEEIDELISQGKEEGWDLFDVKTSKDPKTKLAIEEMTMSAYRQ